MIFTSPANAGEELGRCNASIWTPELESAVSCFENNDDGECYVGDNGYTVDEYDWDFGPPILQGVIRRLGRKYVGPNVTPSWVLTSVAPREYEDWGDSVEYTAIADCRSGEGGSSCGGPNRSWQVCYSRTAFTDASTQNEEGVGGEQCATDADIPLSGVNLQRDQTWYMLSIDRSVIGETKYCQIEIKTLASGEDNPSEPPGTGGLRCVGLKPGDACTGIVSGLPDIIEPGEEIEEGDLNGLPPAPAIATPALPGLALAMLAGIIGWVGIIRSRRRRALR